jgi:hypothetical protein
MQRRAPRRQQRHGLVHAAALRAHVPFAAAGQLRQLRPADAQLPRGGLLAAALASRCFWRWHRHLWLGRRWLLLQADPKHLQDGQHGGHHQGR